MRSYWITICLLAGLVASAQTKMNSQDNWDAAKRANERVYNKYWIQFSDKDNNGFDIADPDQFLSPEALARRTKYGIPVEFSDLPMTAQYLAAIRAFNVPILVKSKWLNSVSIETTDTLIIDSILQLPFVSVVEPVAATQVERYLGGVKTEQTDFFDEATYGNAYNQINMVRGDYLHQQGFKGKGMKIGVFDSGFLNVDDVDGFDSLWINQRIKYTWDFVAGESNVFNDGSHGTNVLSVMAGNIAGEYYGGAPEADYYLFRTEEGASEYRIEEDNWLAAAELADSLGLDMINSSLGYSIFDDSTMTYVQAEMDGNTTRITQAGDLLARKGVLVVNSAGNSGDNDWGIITAPADGDSVFAIGAVNSAGEVVGFSSRGPSADGRVKPNVMGQGRAVALLSPGGSIITSNGTSFSAPLIASLTACLWQSMPEKSNLEMMQIVQESASLYSNPNNSMGYGIPDFQAAHLKYLRDEGDPIYSEVILPVAYPNPFTSNLSVMVFATVSETYQLEVFGAVGQRVAYQERYIGEESYHQFDLSTLSTRQNGVYIIRILAGELCQTIRVLKM